jgi:hypothetical protein
MSNAWDHLPNAKHIDRIIQSLKDNPRAWDAAGDAAWAAAWDAARAAVMALIAWDNCAYLLDTDPDKVRVLALLGQPAAILLLPAVIVFNQVKEMA